MTDNEALERDVQTALADVLRKHDNSMMTRFVVVAEVMDGDGDNSCWTFVHEDAKRWEILGLLLYAQELESPRSSGNSEL